MEISQLVIAIPSLIATIFIWKYAVRIYNHVQAYWFSDEAEENKRSQQDLDWYMNSKHPLEEIGKMYERQIGYLYEIDNHDVEFAGLLNGLADRGRDLIIRKNKEVLVVQAKCWSKKKAIPTKEVYYLYGAAKDYEIEQLEAGVKARPVFISACKFMPDAHQAAKRLGVEVINMQLDKTYPMIKCNIAPNGSKAFHLPTDPYYDHIKIKPSEGEFYAKTVTEAASKGFRRTRTYKKVS